MRDHLPRHCSCSRRPHFLGQHSPGWYSALFPQIPSRAAPCAPRSLRMHYTQDESYYILDCGEDSVVYLGLKEGVDSGAMLDELKQAQGGEIVFDADKYVNKWKAKRHDHFLIPGGTAQSGSMRFNRFSFTQPVVRSHCIFFSPCPICTGCTMRKPLYSRRRLRSASSAQFPGR